MAAGMKIILLLTFGVLILALPVWGQPFGMGHQDGHFSRPETGPTATPREKITGHCVVLPGGGNLITQPCGSLLLTLTSKESGEILNCRTSSEGYFEFNVPPNKEFVIGVSSRFYEIQSPHINLTRGQNVDLQLRQK
jgi:hypothetical protein